MFIYSNTNDKVIFYIVVFFFFLLQLLMYQLFLYHFFPLYTPPLVMNPFNSYASDFYCYMISRVFSNSILQLPGGKSFPAEFGELGAGILMKRRYDDLLIEFIQCHKRNTYAYNYWYSWKWKGA